jgi:hypothetical protein
MRLTSAQNGRHRPSFKEANLNDLRSLERLGKKFDCVWTIHYRPISTWIKDNMELSRLAPPCAVPAGSETSFIMTITHARHNVFREPKFRRERLAPL